MSHDSCIRLTGKDYEKGLANMRRIHGFYPPPPSPENAKYEVKMVEVTPAVVSNLQIEIAKLQLVAYEKDKMIAALQENARLKRRIAELEEDAERVRGNLSPPVLIPRKQ